MPVVGIYGVGGFGRELMPLVREQMSQLGASWRAVFVDDVVEQKVAGIEVLKFEEFCDQDDDRFVVLSPSGFRARRRLASRCDGFARPFEVKASSSVVLDRCRLGAGSVLANFSHITTDVKIGVHFHANIYSYVAHDCVIGDFVTLGPGAKVNGNVTVEDDVYIGTGAIIRQGLPGSPLVLGRGSTIGMGAVVLNSVEPGAVVVGNPARPIRRISSK